MTAVVTDVLESEGMQLGAAVLEALVLKIGLEGVMTLLFARSDRDQALAIIRAQYIATDAMIDSLKDKAFGPKV